MRRPSDFGKYGLFSHEVSFEGQIARVWDGCLKDFMQIASAEGWPYVSRRYVLLRLALRRSAKNEGCIRLGGVFELQAGFRSFRFTCLLPAKENPRLRLVDLCGRSIKADTIVVAKGGDSKRCSDGASFSGGDATRDPIVVSGEMKLVVLAAILPADSCEFFVFAKGAKAVFIDRDRVNMLVRERDLMMVNPGNDGLYHKWVERNAASWTAARELARKDEAKWRHGLLFSIITPVFNTPIAFLEDLICSIKAQTYGNWEHILVNASPDNEAVSDYLKELEDERFKVITLEGNRGISENTKEGIRHASGDYIAFVDHDDVLDRFALEEYANVIAADPDTDMLYCDEDSISSDGKRQFSPIFKPGFNADLILSRNYIIHMLMVSRRALNRVEAYGDDVSGAQDYDLVLKVSKVANGIVRVPRVLYHWRQHEESTTHAESSDGVVAGAFTPSVVALKRYLLSQGIKADVVPHENTWLYRVAYPQSEACDVALVVDHKDPESTERLLKSLESQRVSILREIVVVGDKRRKYPSVSECVLSLTRFLPTPSGVRARCINEAVRETDAKYVLLADGGVEFLPDSDAVGLLRDAFARKDVGIASAKALAADGLNLHAGLCVKEDGSIGYLNQGFVHGMGGGYNGCAECCCDYSAVDSSCMAFGKDAFQRIGGFAENYKSRLARDVDFSFRMRELGKVVLVNPDARVRVVAYSNMFELGASHLKGTGDLKTLWDRWDASYRQDVLANPNYLMEKSFFNLNI